MTEQISPTPCACITAGHHGHRLRPRDGQVRIVVRDRDVLSGIVRAVDAVAHVRGRGERLEAMQKARRNVEVPKGLVVEQERLLLPESRRTAADVDDDVVNGPMGTTDQLGFSTARAAVHAPHGPLDRPGLRVLDEAGGDSGRAHVLVEDVRVEGSGEQSTGITGRQGYQDHNASELGRLNVHEVMLP